MVYVVLLGHKALKENVEVLAHKAFLVNQENVVYVAHKALKENVEIKENVG